MCAYLKFLKYLKDNIKDSSYFELKKTLKKEYTTFEYGLKTLSYLLCVKSHEIPYGKIDPNDIWSYFNGPLSEEYLEFLDDLEKEELESVLVNVTHLLTDNVMGGLGPIISKLGFGALGKEFYSRTVALLVNLSLSAYERFGSSVGGAEITIPPLNEMDTCEKVEEWRMSLLNRNLTFSLCRLTIAVSVFGTEEFGLFESFSELTVGLLGLFDRELWMYVIGSFPTVCFDNEFLFSVNSRASYIEVISDQYLNLVRSLITSKIYPYDYGRNKVPEDNSETLYVLMMCGFIDYLSNYYIHNLVLNNQKGYDNKVMLNSCSNWLSNNLNNRVVMDMMYTVFKFDYKLCFETLLRLTYFNENLMFVDNILFKSDLKDKVVFSLLYRLDLEVVSKDSMSLATILNYMLDGVKGSRKSHFLRLWNLYLSQCPRVKMNLDELNKFLDQILKYLFENSCKVLQYSESLLNPDTPTEKDTNKTNKGSEEVSNVDQVLLHRSILIKVVEILGFDVIKPYREQLVSMLDEGYKMIKKHDHSHNDVSKVEFSLFLIWFLGLKDEYPDFEKVKSNNINVQYNLYLISLNNSNKNNKNNSNKENKQKTKNNKKEDSNNNRRYNQKDYEKFVLFYNIRRMLKNHGKGYFVHLHKLTNWYYVDNNKDNNNNNNNNKENQDNKNTNSNNKDNKDEMKNKRETEGEDDEAVGKYMFKLLFDKYRKKILYNVVSRFPELNHESFSTAKFYLKSALVYFRIYEYLMWDEDNKKNNRNRDNNKENTDTDEKDNKEEEEKEVKRENLEELVNNGKSKKRKYNKDNKNKDNNSSSNNKENKQKKKNNKKEDSNNNKKEDNKENKDEDDEYKYSESQVVNKYMQSFERILLDSLTILIKYDQLVVEYEELVRYILYLGSYHYLKVLDCNYYLTNNVVELIIESFENNNNKDNNSSSNNNKDNNTNGNNRNNNNNIMKDNNNEQFMRKVVLFVIRLTNNLMLESSWNLSHLKLFENLVVLFTKMLRNTNYINSLMTHKQGSNVFKSLLVIANSISVQENSFKVNVNMLNLAVLDTVLGLDSEIQARRPTATTDNSLRSKDFATKELESVLTSTCGKFKITCGTEEDKLALGTLSVLDLLIYQSFSQIFGTHQESENRESLKNHFKNLNFDLNSYLKLSLNNSNSNYNNKNSNRDNNNKDNKEGMESKYTSFEFEEKELYRESVNKNDSVNRRYKQKDYAQSLLSNQLFYWNYLGPQYMLSLQFIGKLFLGFTLLPQTKLILISDYFFLYASTKTNIKINKVKERFLTDNNLVRSETPMFMYDIYRMIYCNTFK